MKHRKLRIAWSVAWGVVAVLLIGMWVRSDQHPVGWPRIIFQFGDLTVCSQDGILAAAKERFIQDERDDNEVNFKVTYPFPKGFQITRDWSPGSPIRRSFRFAYESLQCWTIQLPFSFLTLIAGLSAGISWLPVSKSFNLRTLLIATTLVALGLGLFVWLAR